MEKMAFNLKEYVKKYGAHKETIGFLGASVGASATPYHELDVLSARLFRIKRTDFLAGNVKLEGSETEVFIPSTQVKDGIPVTVYKPSKCNSAEAPAILVYIHGGGNVVGCRKTHETVCKILARLSPCIVVNVEYRLAPEHRFPANQDDVNCVIDWVAKNKPAVGGSLASKLGVSGDSAGGKLAAVACHEVNQHVQFAVLVYPSVNYTAHYPSQEEFQDDPVLSKDVRAWFSTQYIREEEKSSPRASVILHPEFSYLSPTLIILAELDPLRDGGLAYYETLKQAGVNVQLKMIKGVPHGFWSWPAAFPKTCQEAHSTATEFIRSQS